MQSKPRKMVFWHSEGAIEQRGKICVHSANLIDFILSMESQLDTITVVSPRIGRSGCQELNHGKKSELINVPLINSGRFNTINGLARSIRFLLRSDIRSKISDADISISVGLSGFGLLGSIYRIYFQNKYHTFIVRGNRHTTVKNSSRHFISRQLALLRIYFYRLFLLHTVNRGMSEIWFQGRAYRCELVKSLPESRAAKLKILDAVLRDLPELHDVPKVVDILYLGRLTIEKGLLELVESVSQLQKKGKQFSVKIVGVGPDQREIINAVQKAGLEKQIEFSGFVSDTRQIAKLLRSARVFVLPSYTEGLPRSLLEAAHLGVPIVATPVGGIPSVFTENENILFAKVGDIVSLTEQIEYAFQLIESGQITRLIDSAKLIAENHTFAKRGEYFLQNYGK